MQILHSNFDRLRLRFIEMFDIQLRYVKDAVFDRLSHNVPELIGPLQVTLAAFLSGLLSCYFATEQQTALALIFWLLNRSFDCLDGALARYRKIASDLGGFLDLLDDFIIYSILPMAIALGSDNSNATWRAVAILESTFHINNFVLFYIAAVAEKQQANNGRSSSELTSVMMRPALIEGMESALLFTAMLAFPTQVRILSWTMAGLVCIGIGQRTYWVVNALDR